MALMGVYMSRLSDMVSGQCLTGYVCIIVNQLIMWKVKNNSGGYHEYTREHDDDVDLRASTSALPNAPLSA